MSYLQGSKASGRSLKNKKGRYKKQSPSLQERHVYRLLCRSCAVGDGEGEDGVDEALFLLRKEKRT
jgi:hypothetical protein